MSCHIGVFQRQCRPAPCTPQFRGAHTSRPIYNTVGQSVASSPNGRTTCALAVEHRRDLIYEIAEYQSAPALPLDTPLDTPPDTPPTNWKPRYSLDMKGHTRITCISCIRCAHSGFLGFINIASNNLQGACYKTHLSWIFVYTRTEGG